MSSTTTHFIKSFPKRADITGSPEQAFHMLDNHDKYYKYLLGGISAGTIAALGTIAPGGSFQYLYAPQIYHDLGGEPISIVGTSSNMIGKFSCIYITLGNFKYFPFVEATASMSELLKHTDSTPLSLEHLKFTKDWKSFIDPIRGTFLPNIFHHLLWTGDPPRKHFQRLCKDCYGQDGPWICPLGINGFRRH